MKKTIFAVTGLLFALYIPIALAPVHMWHGRMDFQNYDIFSLSIFFLFDRKLNYTFITYHLYNNVKCIYLFLVLYAWLAECANNALTQ